MGSLFSNTSKSNTQTAGTQSGTTNTSSNLWDNPGLQGFLGQFSQAANNAGNVNVPLNQWQLGGANNQAQVAQPGTLVTGYNTANNISQNGFQPQISQFYNPFENQVVANLQHDFGVQNAQTLDANRGRAAAQGALGNNTGSDALILQGQQYAQAQQLANTRSQGYQNAVQNAGQNAQSQLAGANALGNLTNVGTGANTALANIGQNNWGSLFQNSQANNNQWNQFAQGYATLGNLAGNQQNYSGNTTGNSTTNASQTPSPFSIAAGLVGTALTGMPMGFGKADGGAVTGRGFAGGGSVGSSFADKVRDAMETMRALGGRVDRDGYDDGGWVNGTSWRTSTSSDNTNSGQNSLARGMGELGRQFGPPAQQQQNPGADMLARDQAALGERLRGMLSSSQPSIRPQGMADGGVPDYGAGLRRWFENQPTPTGTVVDYRDPASAYGLRPLALGDGNQTYTPRPEFAFNPFAQMGQGDFGAVRAPQEQPANPFANANSSDTPYGFSTDNSVLGASLVEPSPMGLRGPDSPPSLTANAPAAPAARNPNVAAPKLEQTPPQDSWARGIWSGEAPTPFQNLGAALMRVGNGPFAPMGEAMQGMNAQQIQQRQLERQAEEARQQQAHQAAVLAETSRHNQNVEQPELTRNLVAAGYVPGTPEFQAAALRILGRDRTESAYDTAIAQASAKDVEARTAAITSGQARLQNLTNLQRLVDNPDLPQGRFADWEVEGRRIATALFPGFNFAGVPEAEAFRALSNQAALSLRSTANGEGMPGAMSDQDRNFLMQSVVRLQNTRPGNQLMLRLTAEAEQYRLRANQEAINYIHQRRSNAGLADHMTRWMQQNPMEQVIPTHRATREAVQQTPAPDQNQAQTANFQGYTREQLAAMPEGPVMTPQGQPTGYIRRGNQLVPVTGEPGTQGNPLPNAGSGAGVPAGTYAYENGRLVRRTNSMFTGRWEEVPQ